MKSVFTIAIGATLLLGASSALAGPSRVTDTQSGANGWANSDKAAANSCFGQARGWWASTLGQGTNPYLPPGTSNGDIISQRAQDGTNRESNEEFIATYCALLGD
jgi:hypothetical protein